MAVADDKAPGDSGHAAHHNALAALANDNESAIAALQAVIDAATDLITADTLMQRDGSGRARVGTAPPGTDSTVIASTEFVQAAIAVLAAAAVDTATGDAIMRRDSDGRARVVKPTGGDNSNLIATTSFVAEAIAALISSAPGALDTLDELAAALGDDANFAATMTTALAGKAASSHTHSGADITSGTVASARMAAGSTSSRGALEVATVAEAEAGTDTARAVTPQGAKALLDQDAAPVRSVVQTVTGTTFTPVVGSENRIIAFTNGSAITVTLPQDSALAFPVGGRIDFNVRGAGMATFSAGAGATVEATPSAVTRAQYSWVSAVKIAADTWSVVGDLASP